jgi:tetratricopeptide (TPR) repeat protein
LAELYKAQGKYKQAEPLYQRALSICGQESESTHSATVSTLNNLASLYYDQEKYAQAGPLLVRALAICERTVGPQHPTTQAIRANYTALLDKTQQNKGTTQSIDE